MKRILSVLVATACMGLIGPAVAAGDADAGKAKSAACGACHGADGNSTNPEWPKLAGQHPGYLEKQLADFKSGARSNPLMNAQAAALSEQDMADISAYFSAQTRSPGEATADKVTLGEKIYRGGKAANGVPACIGCHGPAGGGNKAANFPSISFQHAAYVAKSLKDFHSGARSNDMASMMRGTVARMTTEEMDAVSQYVQGLH